MPKGKAIAEIPTIIQILEAAGFASDEIVRRLEILKTKFPTGQIPLDFVEKLVRDNLSSAVLDGIIKAAAADFVSLVSTGKGPIKRDDSALA
jgi:hypothetical protein